MTILCIQSTNAFSVITIQNVVCLIIMKDMPYQKYCSVQNCVQFLYLAKLNFLNSINICINQKYKYIIILRWLNQSILQCDFHYFIFYLLVYLFVIWAARRKCIIDEKRFRKKIRCSLRSSRPTIFLYFVLSNHAPPTKSVLSLCVIGCRQVQFSVLDQILSPHMSKS